MKKKVFRVLFLVAFIFMFAISGCKQRQYELNVGDLLPTFSLPDLQGKKITVPDDFHDQVIIIRFWEEWCVACSKEMPAIDYVYSKYRSKGLVALAVNVGQPKAVSEAFVANLKISYPILLDSYSVTATRYGLKGLPVTFIVDRRGIVRSKIRGDAGKDVLEKIIMDIL